MTEEELVCIHCKETYTEYEPIKEGDHVIGVQDGLLHYDCFDEYMGERYYSYEGVIKDGKVEYI